MFSIFLGFFTFKVPGMVLLCVSVLTFFKKEKNMFNDKIQT